MARALTESERQLVGGALEAYAAKLRTAERTGIDEVDQLVEERAEKSANLSAAFTNANRASISTADEE